MTRVLRWYDTITVNIYWLALSGISSTLTPLVVPLLIQQFVGEAAKATFYGNLRLWTLMAALLVQALMGMLSDRSTLKFGRRRPFILASSILDLVIILVIGISAGLSGITGYWTLFFLVILLSFASNIGQGAVNGLIPDLVPENKRGLYSGVKAILEIPLPLILVSFTIAKLISAGNMWGGLFILMGIITVACFLAMLVPEKQRREAPPSINWEPFIRLLVMTGLFSLIILALGAAVRAFGQISSTISNQFGLLVSTGVVGLLAMGIAIALGVWVSAGSVLNKNSRIDPSQVQRKVNPFTFFNLSHLSSTDHSFIWWVVNRLAYLVGATNLSSFTVYFLQARLGFVREKAAGPAAMLTMFVGVFILVSALPSGWLADKFGHKRLVGVSGCVAALGTLVALLSPSLTLIYVGGCLIGAATGLFFAANWALGTRIVPKGEAGRYLGIANLAGAGAGAIGAYIGGPIADQITAQLPQIPGIGYLVLFSVYGILFLLSVVALYGIKLPGEKNQVLQVVTEAVTSGE